MSQTKFELRLRRFNVPDDELLADIRRVAQELGRDSLTGKLYAKNGKFGKATIEKKFGSWNAALKAAGLKTFVQTSVPKEELLADICRVAKELRLDFVSGPLYRKNGKFSQRNIVERFGSWNEAVKAAGLRTYGIPDEMLFENIALVWQHLGRQPTQDEMGRAAGTNSTHPYSTYRARFGSWNKALECFIQFISAKDSIEPRPEGNIEGLRPVESVDSSELRQSNEVRRRQQTLPARTPRNINWRLRATVLIRDNCICKMCGASPAKDPAVILHVDHVIPYSKGGETVIENLQTLCHICNIGKSNVL